MKLTMTVVPVRLYGYLSGPIQSRPLIELMNGRTYFWQVRSIAPFFSMQMMAPGGHFLQ